MSRTLRLFAIRDANTGNIVKDLYFMTKSSAQAKRDELNGGPVAEDKQPQYVVTFGPDHHRSGSPIPQ